MNFLLFILFVVFVLPMLVNLFTSKKPTMPTNSNDLFATVTRKEKKCPPHAWFSQEIRDSAGNKLGDRLVCKHCGPLKPQGEDY